LHRAKAISVSTLPHQRVGWGKARSWEGTKPGQPISADRRDVPYHMTLCSATKVRGKKEQGGIFIVMMSFVL